MNLERHFSHEITHDTTILASYNTLADCHISKDVYPYVDNIDLYRGEDNRSPRHQLFLKELDHIKAHIYCFQEVTPETYLSCLRSDLSNRGYDLIFEKKPNFNEGCAIAYNKRKFQCLETSKVIIDDEIDKLISTKGLVEKLDINLKHGQVGIFALLKDVETNKLIIVCSTHIVYTYFLQLDVQLLQGCIVMHHAHKFRMKVAALYAVEATAIPFIICGDFNCEPTHYLYKFMTKYKLTDEEFKELTFVAYDIKDRRPQKKVQSKPSFICENFKEVLFNPIPLESAYQKFNGEEPKITSVDATYYGTIDFIFVTPNIEVCGVLDINDDVAKEFEKGGPTTQFASDHLPMAAQLNFL